MEPSVTLDSVDVALLKYLRRDGRRSFTDLAQELNVSVGMVRNRYYRLVERGLLHIIGWTDPVKAGLNAYARVVLKVRPTELIREVADALMHIEEVSFVALTTGVYDLEINLTCRTNDHLLDVLHHQIHKLEGVFETSTTMYLKVLKWASHDVGELQSDEGAQKAPGDTEVIHD